MCSVPMNMLIWIQTVKMDKVKLIYFCSHLRALLIHCFILHLLAKLERIQFTLCLCNLCKFNCFKNEENIDINENLSLLPTILWRKYQVAIAAQPLLEEAGLSVEDQQWALWYVYLLQEKGRTHTKWLPEPVSKPSFWTPYFQVFFHRFSEFIWNCFLDIFLHFCGDEYRRKIVLIVLNSKNNYLWEIREKFLICCQILPEEITTPVSFTDSELDMLKGTNLPDATRKIQIKLKSIYDILFPELFERFPALFHKSLFTYKVRPSDIVSKFPRNFTEVSSVLRGRIEYFGHVLCQW